MKKLLILLLLILNLSSANAKSFIDEVTRLVGSSPEVNINLGTGILKFILAFSDDQDARDARKVMKGLDKIRVSVFELDNNSNTHKLGNLIKSKISSLSKKGYEQLVTIRDKEEMVYIVAKVKKQFLQDAMIIVMDGEDELVIISMEGEVDMQQLAQISSHYDVDIDNALGI